MKRILYGSTEVLNSNQFIEQLNDLGAKYSK